MDIFKKISYLWIQGLKAKLIDTSELKETIKMSQDTKPLICNQCWGTDNIFDKNQAVLTVRGPWLNNHSALCDSRKIYVTHDQSHGHCPCELNIDLSILGIDERTIKYCGVSHDISEVSSLNEYQDWEQDIVDIVKINPELNPKLEILWLTALFVGSLSRIQFKLKSTPLQLCIALLFKMELVNNYSDWLELRNKVIFQWKFVEEIIPKELATIGRRNLMEYLCGRTLSRVNQLDTFNDIPAHVRHIKDPLLKQTLGGSWCVLGSISMEIMNNKQTLNLSDLTWVDIISCVFNNWSSIHRDVTDGTFNNTYYYYKDSGFSMTDDLHSVLFYSLKLSGPAIRSVLAHIDLCDMNSRFKFSENYFHCQAESFKAISQPNEILPRLKKLYGVCTEERLTSYEVYCYCLVREKNSNIPQPLFQQTSFESLSAALVSCLGDEASTLYLTKLIEAIESAITFQRQLNIVSRQHDHDSITEISREYRSLRMSQWSMELNNQLPIGSNLIIIYHVMNWFLDNLSNVDLGYTQLAESQYQFSTTKIN